VSAVTSRNWIKDKVNPLPAKNMGKRKTLISIKELNRYIETYDIKAK